jgi:dTDP-4-amino-4,6-dideoxygalactose transaminase
MINVTKTYLPPIQNYQAYIEKIWESGWLTNNGTCVKELEQELKDYLQVPHLWFCNNGTVVLQMAIAALQLKGEIITTPFSYVATTSAILWQHCTPVFADIEPATLTIDPDAVERLITPQTSAILATHVYGNPCDIERLEQIAQKHGLKIIYDAAHCFGVHYKGQNICNYGDASTLSFHATKLFHTVEGGAIVTPHEALAKELYLERQFGHVGDDHFTLGINGKVSEVHAAMGLCILPVMDQLIAERKTICGWYDSLLAGLPLQQPIIRSGTQYNYAYYPIILRNEAELHRVTEALKQNDILPRRYFYPSLNTLPYLTTTQHCPVSEDISLRVLSLPLYNGLAQADVERVANIVKSIMLA